VVAVIDGGAGQLVDRLLDVADDPAPQIRAVVTTLLIKALDDPADGDMLSAMVRSDRAEAILDPEGAATAAQTLRRLLHDAVARACAPRGEPEGVTVLRDYLRERMTAWAERAVDDADNRKRAEKLLVLADQPELLASAQRRGFFAGMSADDVRSLARDRLQGPVMPETATALWGQLETWRQRVDHLLGDDVILAWELAANR
jgi:hypothetical protein